MTVTAHFQISIWSQLTKELKRKEDKTYKMFLQFQEQGKDALTSLMIAPKILMNNKRKKSKMRRSFQNQPTKILEKRKQSNATIEGMILYR